MPEPCIDRADSPQPSLAALRAEIDRIDDALLDLIEERLAASEAIAARKAADSSRLKLHPLREAAVIERLTRRARLAAPTLVSLVWRELMSYGLQAQQRTEFLLCGEQDAGLAQRVRARFGSASPIGFAPDPIEALEAARTGDAIAIVPAEAVAGCWTAIGDGLAIFDAIRAPDGRLLAAAIGRLPAAEALDACPELAQSLGSPPMKNMGDEVEAAR